MSVIEKMAIIGVRSFGPDDKNQQVITFQHPLTLLVGPNGAGKTTIIECLRYATTGEHPLNTKGGAFVHDPKLAHESEVRAKVRLKCKSIRGQEITVERGMMTTQKQKTVQFKTLDGVIIKIVNGEKQHLSSKCAEINREMVSALGVSKAVLDNVIFVHQEESNWPLSEGKSVKQRFDDIFAATRYIKALDEIRKVQKNQRSEKSQEDVALKYLETNKSRAAELRRDLEHTTMQLQEINKSKEKVKSELTPTENQLREFSKKFSEISELTGELKALKSRKEQMIDDKKKVKERINNLFNGSDGQLKTLQKKQDEIMKSKKVKLECSEAGLRPIEEEVEEMRKNKTKFSVEQGKLQQEVKNAEQKRRLRSELISEICREYNIDIPNLNDSEMDEDKVEQFDRRFKKYAANELRELKNQKLKLDNIKREVEDEFQAAWQEKVELQEGLKHKEKTLIDLKGKQAKNIRELNRIKSAADTDQLEIIQAQFEEATRELEKAENGNDIEELKSALKDMKAQKSKLEHELDEFEKEIIQAQKSAQTRTKLDMLENDKLTKEEQVRRLKAKNEASLSQIGFSPSSFPDRAQLDYWIQEKEEDVKTSQKDYQLKRSNLEKLKFKLEATNKEISSKEQRQNKLDETLFEVCGSQDLEQDISELDADIKKLRGKKGLTDGIQHMYRKFIAEMKKEDISDKKEVPCPLCHRLFDETSEVDELITDLENKLAFAPKKLENQTKELTRKEERYKLLVDHKPYKLEYDRLSQTDIPQLRSQSSALSSEAKEIEKQTKLLEKQCAQLLEEENLAKNCKGDVAQVDTLLIEIRVLKREIKSLENQIPASTSKKSIDELNEEKRTVSEDLKKLNKSIDKTQRDIESKTTSLYRLKEKVNTTQAEKLNLTADLQKREQLEDVKKLLETEIEKVKAEMKQNESERVPKDRKEKEMKKKKDEAGRKCEEKGNEMNRRQRELDSKYGNVSTLNQEIQQFHESGSLEKLERINHSINETQKNIHASTQRQQQLRNDIRQLRNELAICTDRQRDFQDNVALRERTRDIERVAVEIQGMEDKLGGMDASKLDRENRSLNAKYDKLIKERVRFIEREGHLNEEIKKLKTQLKQDDYKNADERYRDSLLNSTTLELAVEDLGKYYKALDRAVMQFHRMKMNEINKIIKDLWQETYRGKDIDYIEICSSEDTGSSTSAKRVFNYRVVMYANNISMDMRGRCSAGQKVLASLVIRLALAEAFCINCGILALDEPTTNLDRENIESLARALVSIIESRSQQRNFQLMVITHDEDFVDLLGRSNYVDHFFRITKDERSRFHCTRLVPYIPPALMTAALTELLDYYRY